MAQWYVTMWTLENDCGWLTDCLCQTEIHHPFGWPWELPLHPSATGRAYRAVRTTVSSGGTDPGVR